MIPCQFFSCFEETIANLLNFPSDDDDSTDDDELPVVGDMQFQQLLNLYQRYAKEKGVQPVPDHYTQEAEIIRKVREKLFASNLLIGLLVLLTLGLFVLVAQLRKRGK